MNIEILPVVNVDELENEINRQYDVDYDLRNMLFFDEYVNDCYKKFYYKDLEVYEGKPWQDADAITRRNVVKTYLQDILPNYKCILLDVSW